MKKLKSIISLLIVTVMLAGVIPLVSACKNDKIDEDTTSGEEISPAEDIAPVEDIAPAEGVVYYSEFGAVGDGKTDDFEAICATHEYANKNGVAVAADRGKTYYIGGEDDDIHNKTAHIKTNTYWQDAKFIIDDSKIPEGSQIRSKHIFSVDRKSVEKYPKIPDGFSLSAGQTNVGMSFDEKRLLFIANSNKRDFDRYGHNTSADRTEIIIVDENGNVDPSTPIIWDFTEVTTMRAYPIADEPITVSGGEFTTINNRWSNSNIYFNRGLGIGRSNTTIYNVTHKVEGEGETGAPYNGFFTSSYTNNVTFKNCKMSGRKYYKSGSYDTSATACNNISWVGCTQLNDIKDASLWGIMGTNWNKNMRMEGCRLSRFDAHKGMYGGVIKNCEIGLEISFVGYGTLTMENVHRYGAHFFALRKDYGSFWDGEIIMKDCTLTTGDKLSFLCENSWFDHDFGYTCRYPEKISLYNYKVEYTGTAQTHEHNVYRGLDELTPERVANSTNPLVMTKTIEVFDSGNVFTKVSNNPNGLFAAVNLIVH